MGFTLTADFSGLFARLAHLRDKWESTDLEAIGQYGEVQMLEDSQQSFLNEEDPTDHLAWARRKHEGEVYKNGQPKDDGHPLLRLSTRLMRSVRTDHELSGRGSVFINGGTLPLDYAAVHQFGSRDGRIPARPYVGLSPERQQNVALFAAACMAEGA